MPSWITSIHDTAKYFTEGTYEKAFSLQYDARIVYTDGTLYSYNSSGSIGIALGVQYIESIIGGHMFKFLTLEERNRRLEAENKALMAKNQQLEEALLELEQYVSEVKHGETVCTEDNE